MKVIKTRRTGVGQAVPPANLAERAIARRKHQRRVFNRVVAGRDLHA